MAETKTSPLRTLWQDWPGTIATSTALSVGELALGLIYPETVPQTTIVSIGVTAVAARLDAGFRQQRVGQDRWLEGRLAKIEDPWAYQVAERAINRTLDVVEALGHPSEALQGEPAIYDALTKWIESLSPESTVFAVCTDKTWTAKEVERYLAANYRAIEDGVKITRYFYELSGRVSAEAQRQANAGISVGVLRYQNIASLATIYKLPSDLGIAVMNKKTVFLHRGLGTQAVGLRYDSPDIAAMIQSLFEQIREVVTFVPPELDAPSRSRNRYRR